VSINWTLFGQMVFFVLFVLFCMRYVWPPVMKAMTEREAKITEGLSAADRAAKDLELAQEKASEELKEAKVEAAQIIEQAKRRGDQMVDEAKEKAREEAERILAAAQSEIDQQISQAKEALRGQVAALAVAGAEKIIRDSVDASKHSAMLDELTAEL
jgi:F-type H+-transporting ATPase subunit b